MQHEIRFRAFQDGSMIIQNVSGVYAAKEFLDNCYEDTELMMYSGLKYIDGQEICQGDIFSNGVCNWQVKFETGCFVAEPIGKLKHLKNAAIESGDKINLALRAICPKGKLKYLGNIHENPELLS